MKKLSLYISLLLLLTCAKEDNTSLIEGYQLQISQLNSKITEYSSQVSQLQSTVNSLNSQVNTIPGLEDTITSLNEQIGDLEETIEALTSEASVIPDLNDEITSLEETITSLNEQIEELEILVNIKNNPPIVLYDTSLENHELNDGWFANNTHNVNNYLNASFLRGFTYIDYEGDGDMDVFICRPPFMNVGMADDALDYGIILNTEDGWEFKKDMIKTQLPYYASMITTSDLDNDGDGDIVVFIADDPGNYEGGTVPVEGAGGIYSYLWEDGSYELQVIEPYQEIGSQGYYHGGTLGDVNRDGLVDVVAGTDVIKVWFNNGDGSWTKQQLPSFEDYEKQYGLWVCSQFLVDINKDGNVDLIVGAPMDKYRDINTGTAEDGFANSTHIFLGTGSYPYYNQTPDIVLVNPYIDKSDWKNTHDCTFDISVVDWDNDGDLDIFTNTYKFYGAPDGHLINYYENNNNEFTFKNLFKDNQQYYQGCSSGFMKVYDIDNDGNKEILLESGRPDVSLECSEINAYKLIEGKLQKTKI